MSEMDKLMELVTGLQQVVAETLEEVRELRTDVVDVKARLDRALPLLADVDVRRQAEAEQNRKREIARASAR